MTAIIHSTDSGYASHGVAFHLDDLAAGAGGYLAKIRAEGEAMLAEARRQSDAIRQQAEADGRANALREAEALIEKQLAPVLPALRQAVADIRDAKQAWLVRWEAGAIHLATAIAQRVIRREIERQPEITLNLVREALNLAAGSGDVRICLNPADHKALGKLVKKLAAEMAGLGSAELAADPQITAGGCRVETRFGSIDQQVESQLKRIEEELSQ